MRVWPKCGHPRTPENSQSVGDDRLRCKICRREIARRSDRKCRRGPMQEAKQ